MVFTLDEVALSFNVSRSSVIKWVKQKQKLIDASKSEYKNHLKIRPAAKYVNLYKVLEKKFKECRAKDYCISFAWLWSRARTIYREQLGDESATVKHHVIVNFIKRYNLRMRKKKDQKIFRKKTCELKRWSGILYLGKDLSEQENKMIMMKNGVDSLQNVDLMLTSHHVRLCLIQVAHITSLQKISIM